MSNIHGLSSLPINSTFSGNSQRIKNPILQPIRIDPREETFWDLLKFNLFSRVTLCGFSCILCIVLVVIFIIQIAIDGLDLTQITVEFLPVNLFGKFSELFTGNFAKVRSNYQFWRFFTAIFLHPNAKRLVSNLIGILIWLSVFEQLLSTNKIRLNFLITGVLGNVLAFCFDTQSFFVGPEPGLYGVYGSALGFLVFNWNNSELSADVRIMWFYQTMMIVIFSIFFSSVSTLFVISSLVSGVFVGFCFSDSLGTTKGFLKSNHEKIITKIGYAFLVGVACLFIATMIIG